MSMRTPPKAMVWERLFAEIRGTKRPLSSEAAAVRASTVPKTFAAGSQVARTGEVHAACYLILHGWALCARVLPDGRRQILDFALPGDFTCTEVAITGSLTSSLQAVTDLEVLSYAAEHALGLLRKDLSGTGLLNRLFARQASIIAERLVTVGRRSAYERVVHLLLELWFRLQRVGEVEADGFRMPLTQELLADCLGLSIIHVNRTMQRLRKEGLFEISSGSPIKVRLLDLPAAIQIAHFDPAYLRFDE